MRTLASCAEPEAEPEAEPGALPLPSERGVNVTDEDLSVFMVGRFGQRQSPVNSRFENANA